MESNAGKTAKITDKKEPMMFLFQYTYYVMREPSKRWAFPVRLAKFRTLVLLGLTETLMLAAIYLLIARIMVGHRIPKMPLPSLMPAVLAAFIYGLVIYYINKQILGPDGRIHHYKAIFDSWDKGKHLRWKILLVSIAVLSITAFYVIGEVTQNGFDVQNWKY